MNLDRQPTQSCVVLPPSWDHHVASHGTTDSRCSTKRTCSRSAVLTGHGDSGRMSGTADERIFAAKADILPLPLVGLRPSTAQIRLDELRSWVVMPQNAFAVGEGGLEQRDRPAQITDGLVGAGEIVPGGQCVRVSGPQNALAVSVSGHVQRDRPI